MKLMPLTAALLLAGNAQAQSRSSSVSAGIDIVVRPCACTISKSADLNLGRLYRTASPGSVRVTLAGDRLPADGPYADDSFSRGVASVTAEHCSWVTVTRGNWPAALTITGGSLPFGSAAWAQALSLTGPRTILPGDTGGKPQDVGGEGSTLTLYFFFAGGVTGISSTTQAGKYAANVSVSVSCA